MADKGEKEAALSALLRALSGTLLLARVRRRRFNSTAPTALPSSVRCAPKASFSDQTGQATRPPTALGADAPVRSGLFGRAHRYRLARRE